MLSVTERFARWLRLSGYTQAEIAKQLGHNRSFVTQLKTGVRRPTLDDAVQIEILSGIPAAAWAIRTRGVPGTRLKPRINKARVA